MKFIRFLFFPFLLCGFSFPKPAGFVSDYAGILSPGTVASISTLAGELEEKSGAQFAVLTVKSLEGLSIEEYAWRIFENWGIGEERKDTGVLLLVAPSERKVRIEVGYGFEGAIPDGVAGEVIRTYILPFFKAGEMEKGVLNGSLRLMQLMAAEMNVSLSGDFVPQKMDESSPFSTLLTLLFLFLILGGRFFFWPLLFMGGGGYWGRGGGGFGGFSGFGGGLSGGGGASGSW